MVKEVLLKTAVERVYIQEGSFPPLPFTIIFERVFKMTKITNRDITDKFILYFEGNEPFTPSDKRMMGIKLAQLRKNVSQYIEENNIETNLSVNEIIMDCIEYSKMIDMKFRSIASLGYGVLGESIEYWKKRRRIMAIKEQEKDDKDFYNQSEHKDVAKVIAPEYNDTNSRKRSPKWMNNDKW